MKHTEVIHLVVVEQFLCKFMLRNVEPSTYLTDVEGGPSGSNFCAMADDCLWTVSLWSSCNFFLLFGFSSSTTLCVCVCRWCSPSLCVPNTGKPCLFYIFPYFLCGGR